MRQIVLDFQLREHEKFLRKFFLIFKTIDVDNNGIIDEVGRECNTIRKSSRS